MPKGPSNYRPETASGHARALERRNWALGEMVQNGWITEAQYREAAARPLGTVEERGALFDSDRADSGGYYIEEVRRRLSERFCETDEDGPQGVDSAGRSLNARSLRSQARLRSIDSTRRCWWARRKSSRWNSVRAWLSEAASCRCSALAAPQACH